MKLLGRLQRVENVRDYWKTEDRHFTPWLSDEDNISILGQTLNIDLDVEAVEKSVGPFRADILCRDTDDSSLVLIENQLERTDHKHLGQLMTYAAGLDTATIIWIAVKFDDEHRAALDWLNEKTDDSLRFFGLEIELWTIDEGPAAPKFNIVSKPNEWTRSVGRAAKRIQTENLTETKALQLDYWEKFHKYLLSNSKIIKPQKAYPQHWMNFGVGRTGFLLGALLNSRENYIGLELYMNDDNAKPYFDELILDKNNIEKALGIALDWRRLPDKKASRLLLVNKNCDPSNITKWPEYFDWMHVNLEKFHMEFYPRIKKFRAVL